MAVVALAAGSGFWAYAQHAHENGAGHMMHGEHQAQGKDQGHHGGMMPMIHQDMSQEEMQEFCNQMQSRHQRMQTMREKNRTKLNDLVQAMKQTQGAEKVQKMQSLLVELVKQHKHRGKMMMGSMHRMMGSMMGMHRMSDQQRQQMMQRMQDCPMMRGSSKNGGADRGHTSSMMHSENQ